MDIRELNEAARNAEGDLSSAGYDLARNVNSIGKVLLAWVQLEIHKQDRRERGYRDEG